MAMNIPEGWVLVPAELTSEITQHLQMNTDMGAEICGNYLGGYSMMDEYHKELVAASARVLESMRKKDKAEG